jgi:hypothetical protein
MARTERPLMRRLMMVSSSIAPITTKRQADYA